MPIWIFSKFSRLMQCRGVRSRTPQKTAKPTQAAYANQYRRHLVIIASPSMAVPRSVPWMTLAPDGLVTVAGSIRRHDSSRHCIQFNTIARPGSCRLFHHCSADGLAAKQVGQGMKNEGGLVEAQLVQQEACQGLWKK